MLGRASAPLESYHNGERGISWGEEVQLLSLWMCSPLTQKAAGLYRKAGIVYPNRRRASWIKMPVVRDRFNSHHNYSLGKERSGFIEPFSTSPSIYLRINNLPQQKNRFEVEYNTNLQ